MAVESLLTADGPALDAPEALARSEGILLGCSGIFPISFFASSQASKFFTGFLSDWFQKYGYTHLLAPLTVAVRHGDGHLT